MKLYIYGFSKKSLDQMRRYSSTRCGEIIEHIVKLVLYENTTNDKHKWEREISQHITQISGWTLDGIKRPKYDVYRDDILQLLDGDYSDAKSDLQDFIDDNKRRIKLNLSKVYPDKDFTDEDINKVKLIKMDIYEFVLNAITSMSKKQKYLDCDKDILPAVKHIIDTYYRYIFMNRYDM